VRVCVGSLDQVQLLYATTAHRAEGTTVDTAHPLITAGMTREALYVLATRARESTVFYVATHDLPFDEDDRVNKVRFDPRQYAAREILLGVLSAECTVLSATETITTTQEEAGSLATLVPRYLHAAHLDAETRYHAAAAGIFGSGMGSSLVAGPAWGAVVRRLYDAETNGWEPARLLATVAAQRELDSADSVAEVIAWRIDGDRLAAMAAETLGPQLAGRARSETAWPAFLAALRRAECSGYDPGVGLPVVGRRCPRTAYRPQRQRSPRLAHGTATGRYPRLGPRSRSRRSCGCRFRSCEYGARQSAALGSQPRDSTGGRRKCAAGQILERRRRAHHRPHQRTSRHRRPAPSTVDEPARPAPSQPRTRTRMAPARWRHRRLPRAAQGDQ